MTAQVLDEALQRQSARALAHYLDELHELGGELSLASGLAAVSAGLARSPTAPTTTRCTGSDEPYRRAIAGIYARLATTARDLDHRRAAPPSSMRRPMRRRRSSPPTST